MDNSSIIGGRVNSLRQLIFQKLDALGVRIDDLDSTMQSKDEPSVLTSAGRYVESTPVVFDQNKFNQETKEYGRWDSIGLLDCMHLVMAEQGDVDCLLTYDSHYKRILGSSVESILIREVYQ
jgi:predicted nucleic acid-binding protein